MQENVGDTDQRLRIVVGSGLVLAAMGPLGARRGTAPGLTALVSGALLLESAITRTCPINEWIGIDTRDPEARRTDAVLDAAPMTAPAAR